MDVCFLSSNWTTIGLMLQIASFLAISTNSSLPLRMSLLKEFTAAHPVFTAAHPVLLIKIFPKFCLHDLRNKLLQNSGLQDEILYI